MSTCRLTMAVTVCLRLTVTTATVSAPKSLAQRSNFVPIRGGASAAAKTISPQQQQELFVGATIPNEILNLVKSIVGAGVLGLPAGIAAFADAPGAVLPASLFILGIGILSGYGFALIGRACAYTNSKTYGEAWSKTVSPKTAWMPATACLLVTSCTTLAYSMILSDTVPQLAQAFLGITLTRTKALIGVTSLVLLPLCLSKELSKLAPFSLAGIIGMIYTVVAMAVRYFQGSYQLPHGYFLSYIETQPSFGTNDSVWNPNSFLFISMISTAFMAHYNAPKFYFELRNHTLPRYYTVVSTSFGIAIFIFVAVAALGFLTFGQAAKGLVLQNYATQDALMSVSRIAVAISILFSYPLAFVGVRDGALDLAKISNRSNVIMLNSLTVALLAAIMSLAFVVKDLKIVLAFGGATWGNAVIYLFSTYMFCSLAKKDASLQKEVKWATATGLTGLTMGIIGTVRAIKSMQVS